MSDNPAVLLLRSLPVGTRVVVRSRIAGGYTDALGYLTAIGATDCSVLTRRGEVLIALPDVALAKPVPEPPPRRAPRHPGPPTSC